MLLGAEKAAATCGLSISDRSLRIVAGFAIIRNCVSGPATVLDVGLFHPVVPRRLGYSRVLGFQRWITPRLALPGHSSRVATKLWRGFRVMTQFLVRDLGLYTFGVTSTLGRPNRGNVPRVTQFEVQRTVT